MQLETIRKNVLKTVPVKQTKLGLRMASKDSIRAAAAQGVVLFSKDVGHLIYALNSYVLGQQFSAEAKSAAFEVMGDIGADLLLLSKILKVKMPTATKKVKLVGTR